MNKGICNLRCSPAQKHWPFPPDHDPHFSLGNSQPKPVCAAVTGRGSIPIYNYILRGKRTWLKFLCSAICSSTHFLFEAVFFGGCAICRKWKPYHNRRHSTHPQPENSPTFCKKNWISTTWNPKQPFINGCLVKQPFSI